MWQTAEYSNEPEEFYSLLLRQLASLTEGERDWLANLSNAAALLKAALKDVNWAGFYLLHRDQLVLGPFQGLPACIRIPVGRGVCGTSAAERRTVLVKDVHQFPGHIACDAASASELVIPLFQGQRLLGVMDLDSPLISRFSERDAEGLEKFTLCLSSACDWPKEETEA